MTKNESPPRHMAVSCAATNPDQQITLYKNGWVRVHVRNMSKDGTMKFRTMDYRPKLKADRDAIRRLIGHLNLVASGYEGRECWTCDCFGDRNLRYGYNFGTKIKAPPGWRMLREREPVPQAHMYWLQEAGWIEKKTRSTMTPIYATVWGHAMAYAVPKERKP